jgi:MazG family protein
MASLDELRTTVARLRGPGGCPWDQEQTHQSIRAQLLEEAHEVLEAIDASDDPLLQEELGDLLLHIVFHAQLAAERRAFSLDDVVRGINDKLIRRHPHVFGATGPLGSSAEVLQKWDELKKAEKPARTGPFDGIPPSLPALMRAQETQKKAAKSGYDWKSTEGVLAKLREELAELEAALRDPARAHDECGDLLFTLVNLARHLGIDAEQALRDATAKFRRRFEHTDAAARTQGRSLAQLDEATRDTLWTQAKATEANSKCR